MTQVNYKYNKRDLIQSIFCGQRVAYSLQIFDENHNPIDLFEYGIKFEIYEGHFATQVNRGAPRSQLKKPVIEKKTQNLGGKEFEIEIIDESAGEIVINLCGEETESLRPCVHHYWIWAEGIDNENFIDGNRSAPCLARIPIVSGSLFIVDDKRWAYTINYLRNFIRDYEELNNLEENGEEFTDKDLHQAIHMALDSFNTSNPPLNYQFDINNFPSLRHLCMGATLNLCYMSGLLQTRNELTYSTSGGVAINDKNKTRHYTAWISILIQEWLRWVGDTRRSMNAQACYGSIVSPYVGIQYTELDYINDDLTETITY